MEIIINSVSQLDKNITSDRPSQSVEIIQDTEEIKREIKKLKEYLGSYDSSGIDFFDEIKTSLENIGFEENTELIKKYLEKYDPAHVHSTLEEESRVNPFLRFNDKKIISVLEKRGLPTGTEYERWESLMSLM